MQMVARMRFLPTLIGVIRSPREYRLFLLGFFDGAKALER
jgi:hypothetical protein